VKIFCKPIFFSASSSSAPPVGPPPPITDNGQLDGNEFNPGEAVEKLLNELNLTTSPNIPEDELTGEDNVFQFLVDTIIAEFNPEITAIINERKETKRIGLINDTKPKIRKWLNEPDRALEFKEKKYKFFVDTDAITMYKVTS